MTYTNKPLGSSLLAAAFACAPLIGCATAQPPQELIDARAAYTRAENGYARSTTCRVERRESRDWGRTTRCT